MPPPDQDAMLIARMPPDRLSATLELNDAVTERLQRSQRLRPRLTLAVRARLGTLPDQLRPVQQRVLAAEPEALQGLAATVGAVWLAPFVLNLLDGTLVRAFNEEVGEAPREAARRWRELSGDLKANSCDAAGTSVNLATYVIEAGWTCLRAWSDAQPSPIACRVLLLLPIHVLPDDMQQLRAAVMVEKVLSSA